MALSDIAIALPLAASNVGIALISAGAALLGAPLIVAGARLQAELDGDAWNDEAAWTPSLGADDRRDLFRYLHRSEFWAVIEAEGRLTIFDAHRKTLRGLDDPDRTVKPSHSDANYKETLEKAEKARDALQRVSIEGQEFEGQEFEALK